MTDKTFSHAYSDPWHLHMQHKGFSHIHMQWQGPNIHFHPIQADDIQDGDIVILLWNWIEQLQGTVEAIQRGIRCTVVAPEAIVQWLPTNTVTTFQTAYQADGLNIDLEAYQPIPAWTYTEGLRKLKAGIQRPFSSYQRLVQRRSMPQCDPHIAWITFPSGAQFAHLHLSIHSHSDANWLRTIYEKTAHVSWMVVGCDYEEEDAFVDNIIKFTTEHILLSDLIGDYRRKVGMPCQLLTPLADKIIDQDRHVQIFATQVGYRFDTIALR